VAVAPSADLAQGQFCASATFDLAQSLSALTSTVVKASGSHGAWWLPALPCGLDRTGNTAVIEGALALAIPAFPALGERAQHCQKLALFWSACLRNR
jgi:hypothetical protein